MARDMPVDDGFGFSPSRSGKGTAAPFMSSVRRLMGSAAAGRQPATSGARSVLDDIYMAEIAKEQGPRTDQYALGRTAWEGLAQDGVQAPTYAAAGGGGGAASAAAARKRALKLLQDMQTQGTQQVNTGYENLLASLRAQQNPYANLQAETTQASPELQQLLQAQGAPTDPLMQFAAAMQSANTGRQDAFNEMMKSLAGTWTGSQQNRITDVTAQRDIDLQNLANQVALQRLAMRMGGR